LKYGADPSLEDHAGLKAKDYAVSAGKNKIATMLENEEK